MIYEFEAYLRGVDAKDSTRATYRKALECFEHWMNDREVALTELDNLLRHRALRRGALA